MDNPHRKIELQSPADLTHLTTQLRSAALQKLNLHLPPVPGSNNPNAEPDDLRRAVETLVDAFVAQVIQGMRANISINGLDVEPGVGEERGEAGEAEEVFEAFDEKLREKLGDAVRRRDELVKGISVHRRGTGAKAKAGFEERWEREGREIEHMWGAWMEEAKKEDQQGVLGASALERQEDVERNWERAVQGLLRLNKGLPETRARLERAGDVVGYLDGQQQKQGRGR